jgi:hypothetical protein
MGGNLSNSRDKSFEKFETINTFKTVCVIFLAGFMKCRKIVLNTIDMLALFEFIALCMIIRREKSRSLELLLF